MVEVGPSQICVMMLQCNQENSEHLKYLRNAIVLQGKSQSGVKKLNCKQEC